MSAAEKRKAIERELNRAFLRAKLIEAHEFAARATEVSPHNRRCMLIGWLLGASGMGDDEVERLTRLLQDEPL